MMTTAKGKSPLQEKKNTLHSWYKKHPVQHRSYVVWSLICWPASRMVACCLLGLGCRPIFPLNRALHQVELGRMDDSKTMLHGRFSASRMQRFFFPPSTFSFPLVSSDLVPLQAVGQQAADPHLTQKGWRSIRFGGLHQTMAVGSVCEIHLLLL
jgi:hypothetical protein